MDTATNPADVCTKALPGNRIRELCRLARVYECRSEGDMGDDPDGWYLSRLMNCAGERCWNRAATLSLKVRVDFTCLNCFSQTHFASAVWDTFHQCCQVCGIHSACGQCFDRHKCLICVVAHLALCASALAFPFRSLCVSMCALCGPHDRLSHSRKGSRTKTARIHPPFLEKTKNQVDSANSVGANTWDKCSSSERSTAYLSRKI